MQFPSDYLLKDNQIFIKIDRSIQTRIPTAVGSAMATRVHFHDPVSFLIVRHVVPHGQCNIVNTIIHTAVFHVIPKSCIICSIFSLMAAEDMLCRIVINNGMSSSLAGNDKINATIMAPFIPIARPTGSSISANLTNSCCPEIVT